MIINNRFFHRIRIVFTAAVIFATLALLLTLLSCEKKNDPIDFNLFLEREHYAFADTDIYIQSTASMGGFLKAGSAFNTILETVGSNVSKPLNNELVLRYYRFDISYLGEKDEPFYAITADEFKEARNNADFYSLKWIINSGNDERRNRYNVLHKNYDEQNGVIRASYLAPVLKSLTSETETNRVSVVITDLTDYGAETDGLEDAFAQLGGNDDISSCIFMIMSRYYGVRQLPGTFLSIGCEQDESFERPFYVIITGKRDYVYAYSEVLAERLGEDNIEFDTVHLLKKETVRGETLIGWNYFRGYANSVVIEDKPNEEKVVSKIFKNRDNSKSKGIGDYAKYADIETMFHFEKLGGTFTFNMPVPYKNDERFKERYELYRRFDTNPWDEMELSAKRTFRPRSENGSLIFDTNNNASDEGGGIGEHEKHFPLRLTAYYLIKDENPFVGYSGDINDKDWHGESTPELALLIKKFREATGMRGTEWTGEWTTAQYRFYFYTY